LVNDIWRTIIYDLKIYPIGSEENNTESKRDTSASPTKLRRRRRSKSTEKTRENGTASSDKFRLDQSGSSSSESEDEGSMSEDEYSYSCMVYNKGDQEDSENMDPVSTDLFESFNLLVTSKKRNHEFSNSPIHEFKVLHKGQRVF